MHGVTLDDIAGRTNLSSYLHVLHLLFYTSCHVCFAQLEKLLRTRISPQGASVHAAQRERAFRMAMSHHELAASPQVQLPKIAPEGCQLHPDRVAFAWTDAEAATDPAVSLTEQGEEKYMSGTISLQ